MRGFAIGLAVLAIGQPAAAADLMYQQTKASPEVLSPYDGFAHWQLLGRCSGLMKARIDYDKHRRRPPSIQAEDGARYFEHEAVVRYVADRGADPAKARAVIAYYEDKARAEFDEKVAKIPSTMGQTPANLQITECAATAKALSPPAAPPPPRLLADPQDMEVICEVVATTGSRMGKRLCRTKAEINETREQSRETTERIQSGCTLGACR